MQKQYIVRLSKRERERLLEVVKKLKGTSQNAIQRSNAGGCEIRMFAQSYTLTWRRFCASPNVRRWLSTGRKTMFMCCASFRARYGSWTWSKTPKTDTSKWIMRYPRGHAGFAWQAGYGVFSVSESNLPQVRSVSRTRRNIIGG